MANTTHLPHLVALLDDDSPVVREALVREFSLFGDSLEEEICRQSIVLDGMQRVRLNTLLNQFDGQLLKQHWLQWLDFDDDMVKLEAAQSLLAQFLDGASRRPEVGGLLDQLAEEYRSIHKEADPFTLSHFLFRRKGLVGAVEDYHNPLNSSLSYVIQEKRGLPISLACVYMLVGYRLGLQIEGCNFPGHFLARAYLNDEMILVDCFDGGKVLDVSVVMDSDPPNNMHSIVHDPVDSEVIMIRVLNNLTHAYDLQGHRAYRDLMRDLRGQLEQAERKESLPPL
jgi:regulator of sirC expression with transglutaminase-like and TPR domain